VDEPDDPVDETPKDTIITEIVDDPQTDPKSGKQYSLQLAVIALSLIHISEPTRLRRISYAVFCLKKKKKK